MESVSQRDRQRGSQSDRQTDRKAVSQTDRQTDRQKDRHEVEIKKQATSMTQCTGRRNFMRHYNF